MDFRVTAIKGLLVFLFSLADSLRMWLLFWIWGDLNGDGEGDLGFVDLVLDFIGVLIGLGFGEK